MKSRIKIDSAILSFIIILTGFLYQFPGCYSQNIYGDDFLDFIGLFVVLTGNFLRMAARGHKKAHSKQGHGLVTTGPYTLVRNPMYLGSFLMGSGFVMIVWPWWTLPLFGGLFYLRFKKQVVKEEAHLKQLFGAEFEKYLRKVPRACPSIKALQNLKFNTVFPPSVIWDTKEVRGLLTWPLLAVLLETFQENIVFGYTDIFKTVAVFILAELNFALVVWFLQKKNLK